MQMITPSNKNMNVVKSTLEDESRILIDWFKSNQMQANPDKFQAISVGVKSHGKIKSFDISCNIIKCDVEVKQLGVEIDYLLNFDAQISKMCQKAAKQLNVLHRLSKFLNVPTRLIIFKSFIRSNFNFCPIVWHFCSKANTNKLEKLQYRALRIVYNDYTSSYESLQEKVKLQTLHLNRLQNIAIETFKCLH